MKGSGLLLGGLFLTAGVLVAIGVASAKPRTSSASSTPPPRPGPGATVEHLPAGTGPGLPALTRTTWAVSADASGQQAGTFILLQAADDPNQWALVFVNNATHAAGVMGYSPTPIGGLLAQMLAAGRG
jgi:hypothetical protein